MFLFWFMQKLFTQKLFTQTARPPAPQWSHPKRTWALPAKIFPHLKMILRTWKSIARAFRTRDLGEKCHTLQSGQLELSQVCFLRDRARAPLFRSLGLTERNRGRLVQALDQVFRFDLKFRLFIGLHHLRIYHRWKENINLDNIWKFKKIL